MKMEEWEIKQPWKDKAAKLLHKPNAPQTLELLWKEELSAATGGSFVANLTGKQKGQIGHFRKACPKEAAEKVMIWAIKNWVFFTKRVQVQQSVKFIPAHPTLDFLLQYVGTAVTLATPPKTPPKHEATPELAVDKAVQLTSHAPKVESHKQTLAEIYADPDEE